MLLIFFLLMLLFPEAQAQQQGPVLLHGAIFDAGTRQPLPDAHFSVNGHPRGATDGMGLFSLYVRWNDTITFTCIGYSEQHMTVRDTLWAKEYTAGIYLTTDTTMIPAVVIIPRIGNIRAEIMAEKPALSQEMINATNNLRMSVYQGLTTPPEMGDPYMNYEMIRQQLRMDAYDKGQIPSDHMVGLSPFMLLPLIYRLVSGPPETPDPPVPHISARDLERLRTIHDSVLYKRQEKF